MHEVSLRFPSYKSKDNTTDVSPTNIHPGGQSSL